jgi:pimeloyl-ACP methyl ester carboxylesterase
VDLLTGVLPGGLPYDRMGTGPRPVVVFAGLSFENVPASKISARLLLGPFRFLERDFTVYVVTRRPGLPPGTTMGEMADEYATMIRTKFGGPVDVIGVSTGGSIAQQFALDHPDLVRRLVLYSAAHRLGDAGRRFQRRQAELARDGKWGTAMAESMVEMLLPRRGPGRYVTWPVRWLFALFGLFVRKPADPNDFLVTVEAEDRFDVGDRLAQFRTPTLVVGGARDPFYSPALFRSTAAGIPAARLVYLPRAGHLPRGRRVERAILTFLRAEAEATSEQGSGGLQR